MTRLLLIFAVNILVSFAACAQIMPLLPADEGIEDSAFNDFRSRFIEAIETNNTDFIFANSTDDVMNGFGGSGGVEELASYWSNISPEILRVLNQGGHFSPAEWFSADVEAQFIAPYTFRYPREPEGWSGDVDWIFSTGAITSSEAEVFDISGEQVIETLGQVIVVVTDWWSEINPENITEPLWVEIELADGRRGNIAADQINSPVGYRCFFEKKEGKWLFAGWAAGD